MSDAGLIQIPFWNGIDETYDDLRTPADKMRSCRNVVFTNANSIAKRGGFVPVPIVASEGPTLTSLKKVMACRDAVVVTDGDYVYGQTAASGRWTPHGRISPCIATRTEVSTGSIQAISSSSFAGQIIGFDVADVGGLRCIIWTMVGTAAQGGGTYAAIVSIATGEHVMPPRLLNTSLPTNAPGAACRVLGFVGTNQFWVTYQTSTQIIKRRFDIANLVWDGEIVALGATGGTWYYDICQNRGGGDDWILVFHNEPAQLIAALRFDSAGSLLTGATVVSGLPEGPHAVAVRSEIAERVWIAYAPVDPTSAHQVRVVTASTITMLPATGPFAACSLPAGPTGIVLGVERLTSTTAIVTIGGDGSSANTGGIAWATVTTIALTTAFVPQINQLDRQWTAVSKPFMAANGKIYLLGLTSVRLVASQCLLELNTVTGGKVTALPVASITPRTAINDWDHSFRHMRCANISLPGDVSQTTYTTLCFAVNALGAVGVNTVTFDFAHPGLYQTVTLGETSYIAGGLLSTYDGSHANEYGFLQCAPRPNDAGSSTTGGSLGQNAYHYIDVLRYRNQRGEIVRALPATFDPLTVDLTGSGTTTNTANITVYTLNQYGQRKQYNTGGYAPLEGNPIVHEIYRTAFISGQEGAYYLCGTVSNELDGTTLPFADTMSDLALIQQPPLYTTGNVLEYDSPPSTRFLCVHNRRLFAICDEPGVIWYTTEYVAGELPRFNDQLKLSIPGGDGPLVALASFEGRLVAFTARATFVFTGDGPGDTGAGDTWGLPTRLPFGLGCVDPRAICLTPQGIVFLSAKGVYLYDRSGEMVWIGARFQRTLALYQAVAAITHLETDGLVLFWLRSSDIPGVQGNVIVWDYRHECWCTWEINTDVGVFGTLSGATSAEIVGGELYALYAGAFGVNCSLVRYTPSNYGDATGDLPISLRVVTGWVAPADLQGYSRVDRVLIMLRRLSAHTLSLVSEVDYGNADRSVDYTDAQIAAATPGQLRFTPWRQKCQSISISLADTAAASGSQQGPVLEGILFKVRAKRGENKRIRAIQGA